MSGAKPDPYALVLHDWQGEGTPAFLWDLDTIWPMPPRHVAQIMLILDSDRGRLVVSLAAEEGIAKTVAVARDLSEVCTLVTALTSAAADGRESRDVPCAACAMGWMPKNGLTGSGGASTNHPVESMVIVEAPSGRARVTATTSVPREDVTNLRVSKNLWMLDFDVSAATAGRVGVEFYDWLAKRSAAMSGLHLVVGDR